jgi:Dyp-type peroxidase family
VTWPDKKQVQGNVWPGFNKDHHAYLLLTFPDGPTGIQWVGQIAGEVASAEEVAAFKSLYKLVKDRRPDDWSRFIKATWVNVAFTAAGLRYLGVDDLETFGHLFADNVAPEPRRTPTDQEVHALLMLAADVGSDLTTELRRQKARLRKARFPEPTCWIGFRLPDGQEHFGFRDGISQPSLAGLDAEPESGGIRVPAEQFILHAREDDGGATHGFSLMENSSYLVFLKLEQHVAAFRNAIASQARPPSSGPGVPATVHRGPEERLGAALVGRWQSGVPAGRTFDAMALQDPNNWDPERRRDEDPAFPVASHIGRSNPRQLGQQATRWPRVLRRGITYGDPLPAGEADGKDRGLLFVSYQADIAAQFEVLWDELLHNPAPRRGTESGNDPILGRLDEEDGNHRAWVDDATREGGGFSVELPRFVTPRYIGYFFVPSIDALKGIGSDFEHTRIPMTQSSYSIDNAMDDLSELINPDDRDEASAGGRLFAFLRKVKNITPGIIPPGWGPLGQVPPIESKRDKIKVPTQPDSPSNEGISGDSESAARSVDFKELILRENPYLTKELIDSGKVKFSLDADREGPAIAYGSGTQGGPFERSVVNLVVSQANASAADDVLRKFLYWQFDGEMQRISKGVRLTYTYPATDGGATAADNTSGNGAGKDQIQGVMYIGFAGPPWP